MADEVGVRAELQRLGQAYQPAVLSVPQIVAVVPCYVVIPVLNGLAVVQGDGGQILEAVVVQGVVLGQVAVILQQRSCRDGLENASLCHGAGVIIHEAVCLLGDAQVDICR